MNEWMVEWKVFTYFISATKHVDIKMNDVATYTNMSI
jgi:hypothetical protein